MKTRGNPGKVRSHLKSKVGTGPKKPITAIHGLQAPMIDLDETTRIGYVPTPSTKFVKYKGPRSYDKGVKKGGRR